MWSIQQKMYKKSGKRGLHPHGLRPFKSDFWIFSRKADPTFCEIRQNTNCFLIRPSGITPPVPPEKHHADSHGALRSTQYLIRRPISLPCTVWQTGWYPTRCATLFAARLLFNKPYDIVFTGMRAFTRRSCIFLKRPKDAKLPAKTDICNKTKLKRTVKAYTLTVRPSRLQLPLQPLKLLKNLIRICILSYRR